MNSKNILFFCTCILILNCSKNQPNYCEDESFVKFAENYDPQKANDLIKAIESFDNFLNVNFSDSMTTNNKIIQFLEHELRNINSNNDNWILDIKKNQELIDQFEKSGLRKDFWLYGYEKAELNKNDDEIIPIICDSASIVEQREDSVKFLNMRWQSAESQIVYALQEMNTKDTVILSYIDARRIAGNISYGLLLNGLLTVSDTYNYNNILMKIVLVNEIYSGMIYSSVLD